MKAWPALPSHTRWLTGQLHELLRFGRRLPHPLGGAAWLQDDGTPDLREPVHTWITARTAHVYSLGALLGVPGSGPIADAALRGLTGVLRDDAHGGWHPSVAPDGEPAAGKSCYDHAFVVLAASSAVQAQRPGARELLTEALDVLLGRFWEEEHGMLADTWDTGWNDLDPYRGLNANMHGVEALLAASDATGDRELLHRALRIASRTVEWGRAHGWRLPEHFDSSWHPQLDYHRDRPDDPFKPYGATVGHALEWSRLLLHLEASLGAEAPEQLLPGARSLFGQAVVDGWAVDGAPGFVYTTDWDGRPVVRQRMHWVAAEAVSAAAVLHARTGEEEYARHYATWWDYVAEHLVDHEQGSWRHELDPANRPASSVWPGKPDLYHAVQALLVPLAPLAPGLAAACAAGAVR